MRPFFRLFMLSLWLGLLVAPTLAITEAHFETARCPFSMPFGKQEGKDIECGYLTVPEDRANPDSPAIRIAVAILRHPDGNPQPDPIVYLEGGPGGSTLELLNLSYGELYEPFFVANRDLILFDQRGIGESEPALDCPDLDKLVLETLDYELEGQTYTDAELNPIFNGALVDCAADLRQTANLQAYNTDSNAADVNDLRIALGYDQWNVWGISYGTRLALEVARDYPQGVRSLIIDSVYTPDVDLIGAGAPSADRAFNKVFDGCAQDTNCNAAYPDLRDVFFASVDELNANPATITVSDLFNATQYDARLTGFGYMDFLFQSLYVTDIIPILPQTIYEVRDGDYSTVELILSLTITQQDQISIGMNLSVVCNEEFPYSSRADFDATNALFPQLTDYIATSNALYYDVCPDWNAGVAPSDAADTITSDLPTLVLAGEFDPITPPQWAEAAASHLPNSHFFMFPGVGHGAGVVDDCTYGIMAAFINVPAQEPDVSCIAQTQRPEFEYPDKVVERPDIQLVETDITTFGIRTVIPEGWDEITMGTYARQESGLDQTALVVMSMPGAMTPDSFAGIFASSLGADQPELLEERTVGGRDWAIYAIEIQTFPGRMALSQSEGKFFVVILLSQEDELDGLVETVLYPAIEQMTVK